MFLLLSALSLSFFVPPSVTSNPVLQRVSLEEAKNLSVFGKTVFAFFLNSKTQLFSKIEGMVLQAAALTDEATFVFLTQQNIKQQFRKYFEISPHLFTVIKNGEVANAFPLPDSPATFFPMIDFFLDGQKVIIESKEELMNYIGGSSFALLTPAENLSFAMELQNMSAVEMGYIDIVICKPEVIWEVSGNKTTTFALYRTEDEYISAIGSSIDDLFTASYPIYRVLRSEDLMEESTAVFTLASKKLTEDQKVFLMNIAEYTSSFIIGWADPSYHGQINYLSHLRSVDCDVALLSLANNYYYNLTSFFTDDFVNQSFNSSIWTNKAIEAFNAIKEGKLEPVYISEEEFDSTSQVVQKLVGTNINSFIHNSSSECIVLYMKPTCPHCTKFAPVFEQIAQEFYDANISIRFGMIDISKNSCPGGFVKMPGVPHLELFRQNGTNSTQIYCARERNEIIRFLKTESTANITIETPAPELESLNFHLIQLIMQESEAEEGKGDKNLQAYITRELAYLSALKNSTQSSNATKTKVVETEEKSEDELPNIEIDLNNISNKEETATKNENASSKEDETKPQETNNEL